MKDKTTPAVVRMDVTHYDEVIGLMNEVFTRKNGRPMDFAYELPNMCVRDDAHMRKHFGILADGRLVAALGVYPLPARIGGEELLFCTVGNVVTHPDYEGRGYMSALLARAMEEVAALGVDVARLGGLRPRYNRYGFEMAGASYTFTLTEKHLRAYLSGRGDGVSVAPIDGCDRAAVDFCTELYNASPIAVTRTEQTAWRTMTAWRAKPFLAVRDGRPIGYLCVFPDGSVAEQGGVNTDALVDTLCAYARTADAPLTFSLPPYRVEAIRVFYRACASVNMSSPSHFFVRNFEKLAHALMRVKASMAPLPQGELLLGIEGYGTLRLFSDGDAFGCERTERTPTLTLDRLTATRYLFGPLAPQLTADADAFAAALLPLPLGWCGQDRV